jgi:UPF0755 protein
MSRLLALLGTYAPFLGAFIIGLLGTMVWLNSFFYSPVDINNTTEVKFFVDPGANLKTIAQKLEQENLINHWYGFYLLNYFSNKDKNVTVFPGEYRLSASLSPKQILEKFITQDVYYYQFTIPEGSTVKDISKILVATGFLTEEQVTKALNNKALMMKLSLPGSFEGFLYPETYKVTYPDSAEAIIERMVKESAKKFTVDLDARARELGFTFPQILTLASIIEKETGDPSERATISAVFHNRLRTGIPLQSDPTVIYGIPDFNGNITKEDLKTDTPYNTYIHAGLPPTPICNPGLEAVKAALNPDGSEYLFFVAKGDGTHFFSKTYKEHKAAVEEYQKKKAEQVAEEVIPEAPAPTEPATEPAPATN